MACPQTRLSILSGTDIVTRPGASFQPGVVHHFHFDPVVSTLGAPCQVIAERVLRAQLGADLVNCNLDGIVVESGLVESAGRSGDRLKWVLRGPRHVLEAP